MSETQLFLILIAVLIIIFDIYIIMKKGKSESISAYTIRWFYENKKTIVIAFGLGLVCGHLFWSMKTTDVYTYLECKEHKVLK